MNGPVIYLAEIDVHDGVSLTTYRYSNTGFTTTPSDTPSNTHYAPKLQQPVTVGRNIFREGGATSGRGETSNGVLVLNNGDGALDSIFNTGAIDGRKIRVLQGFAGQVYSAFTPIFRGTMLGLADMDQATVRIQVRGREQELETPLQSTLYAGDNVLPNGVEGTSELTGKPKPVCYGVARNVTPICVNTAKLIYQVHDGVIDAIDDVYDSGINLNTLAEWTATTFSGVFGASYVNAAEYHDGLWVAGGDSGKMATSTDEGVTWTSRTSGLGADSVRVIKFFEGPDLWVAVGTGGWIVTSPDGITWTSRKHLGGSSDFNALCIDAGIAVVAGVAGILYTSTDGLTWTSRTSAMSTNGSSHIDCVAYHGGLWVIGGFDAPGGSIPQMAYATDPVGTWTLLTTDQVNWGGGSNATIRSIVYSASQRRWVMTPAQSTNPFVSISPDGKWWTPVDASAIVGTVAAMTYVNGTLAIVTSAGFAGGRIFTSFDGVTWTQRGDQSSGTVSWNGIASDSNGRIIAVGGTGAAAKGSLSAVPAAYATLADLEDDTQAPPAGGYSYYLGSGGEGGYFRLGSPPAGQITADVTEGSVPGDHTKAQIWKRILQDRAGLVSGTDFSATDITAHDTVDAGEVGYYTTEQVSLSDVLDTVVAPGSWWMPDRTGIYRLKQLVAPSGTAAASLVASNIKGRLAKRTNTDPMAGLSPWKVILYYSPNYTVQDSGVAAGVDDTRRADLAKQWRSVTAEDPDVQTKHLLAPTLSLYSNYSSETAAQTECDRQLALRKVQRDRFPVPVDATAAYAVLDAGDVVSLTHTRFGLSAGRKFVLVGVAPDAQSQSLVLELWGGGVNRLYFVDDGAGGLKLSTVAVPAGQLVTDGAGGVKLTEDLTLTELVDFLGQDDGTYALTAS